MQWRPDKGKEPQDDADPWVSRTFASGASRMDIANIFGDVQIVSGASEIILAISGKQSRVNTIIATTKADTLKVTGALTESDPDGLGIQSYLINNHHFGTMHYEHNGSLYLDPDMKPPKWLNKFIRLKKIRLLTAKDKVKLVLHVPPNIDTLIRKINGTVDARNCELGHTEMHLAYSGTAQLGDVQSLRAKGDDNTELTVERVHGGVLKLKAKWKSTMLIRRSGAIDELAVSAEDNARVSFYDSVSLLTARLEDNARLCVQSAATANIRARHYSEATLTGSIHEGVLHVGRNARVVATSLSPNVLVTGKGEVTTVG